MDSSAVESAFCDLIRQDWEDPRYDVKGPMAWDEGKPESIGLIKDVLALANNGGGSLVIGVAEEGGRIVFHGLTPEQLKTWDPTRFGAKVNRYADPPIECTVRSVECDGKVFVLISIPGFAHSPHYCTRDYDGILRQNTIYIRTANSASAPVNDAVTMTRLINQAVAARQDEIAQIVRAAIGGAEKQADPEDSQRFRDLVTLTLASLAQPYEGKYAGYITNVMYPARFETERFTIEQLQRAVRDSQTPQYFYGSFLFRVGGEPVVLNDGLGLEMAWQGMRKDDFYIFWRLFGSGLLIHKELLFEDARLHAVSTSTLYIDYFIQRVFIALDGLVRLYTALGIKDEDITWQIELAGSAGRSLDPGDLLFRGDLISREPTIRFSSTRSIEDWRIGLDDHVVEAVQRILKVFQVDADLSVRIKSVIEKYRHGQP